MRCPTHLTMARLGALLAATAAAAAVAVASAPLAAAVVPTDAGCPAGSLSTSADGTFAGAPVMGLNGEGPGEGGLLGSSGGSSTATGLHAELVGTGCFQHNGDTADLQFSYSSVGRIDSGVFVYQLFDCTVGGTSNELTRSLALPTGGDTFGIADATVNVNSTHTYRMRITGEGSYERDSDGFSGAQGYWSANPPVGVPAWTSQTACA